MLKHSFLFFLICVNLLKQCTGITPSEGAIWPRPRYQKHTNNIVIVDETHFNYQIVNQKCNLLKKVSERYLPPSKFLKYKNKLKANEDHNYLKMLHINLTTPCNDDEYPYFGMDELYHLKVSVNSTLVANSIWGIMRGLESFVQLVHIKNKSMRMNEIEITDAPKYPHRGLLIDTSRHFLNSNIIFTLLDGMVMNKMNVLHWHMTDTESFPYQSKVFPELSAKGAYYYYTFNGTSNRLVYTLKEIKNIIDYAKERGIRVVPEFDTPGHVDSWGASHPELLTQCGGGLGPMNPIRNTTYDFLQKLFAEVQELFPDEYFHIGGHEVGDNCHVDSWGASHPELLTQCGGGLGPMNPIRNTTYDFLQKLFAEVQELFPDEYFHIGGDEVGDNCWKSNQEIQDYVKKNNIQQNLQVYFTEKLMRQCFKKNTKFIGWQEIYTSGTKLPNDSLIEVWYPNSQSDDLIRKLIREKKYVLYAAPWYLDYIYNKFCDLYIKDPRISFAKNEEDEKYIVGGESCMWGELVDNTNIIARVFPRASAMAEVLWSGSNGHCSNDVKSRIEEHTCRMCGRHVMAQPPLGPGVCMYNIDPM